MSERTIVSLAALRREHLAVAGGKAVNLGELLAAGMPVPDGFCLTTAAYADTFQKGEHGSTFAGGPLVCRAALVFLDEVERGLLGQVQERGAQLRSGLEQLQRDFPIVREVRGLGLMLGLRLHHSADAVQKALHKNGLLVNCTAGDVLRIVPPYVVTGDQIERALQLLRSTLATFPATAPTEPQADKTASKKEKP